jgi:hypothetical protein
MARSGVSLRSIYWFAGFFALIVVPQVVGHFYKAVQTTKAEAPRTAALEQLAQRPERGCVADQPQQCGYCCDWLSAQSRSSR